MRNLIFISILLTTVFKSPADASGYKVTSGLHENFTRLVIYMSETDSWSVRKEGALVTVEFEQNVQGFDLESVFNKINRSRVLNIDGSEAHLKITLNCKCNLRHFSLSNRYVVVDILDPAEDDDTEVEAIANRFPSSNTGVLPTEVRILSSPYSQVDKFGSNASRTFQFNNVERPVEPENRTSRNLADFTFEEQIHRQIRSETSDNLLLNFLVGEDVPIVLERNGVQSAIGLGFKVNDSSSFQNSAELNDASAVDQCPQKSDVDIVSRNETGDLLHSITQLRGQIYTQDGSISNKAVLSLAREYLYLNMPQESSAILQLAPEFDEEANVLRRISNSIQGQRKFSEGIEDNWKNCDSAAMLWSFYSDSNSLTLADYDLDTVAREYSRLSLHLRQEMAHKMSTKLRRHGLIESSVIVDELASRGIVATSSSRENSKFPQTSDSLLSAHNGTKGLTQLADHVSGLIDSESSIEDSVVNVLGSYASQFSADAEMNGISSTFLYALISTGRMDEAIQEFRQFQASLSLVEKENFWNQFIEQMLQGMKDVEFLVLLYREIDILTVNATDYQISEIQGRLRSLGYTESSIMSLFSEKKSNGSLDISSLNQEFEVEQVLPQENFDYQSLQGSSTDRLNSSKNNSLGEFKNVLLKSAELFDEIENERLRLEN